MRKLLIAAVMAVLAAPAFAADMPLKAPPAQRGAFITGQGWYVGVGASGAIAASSVQGNNFPALNATNLQATGGSITGDVGYIWANCFLGTWCQFEVDGKYQNISGTTAVGSVSSQWALSEESDVGAQLIDMVASFLPVNTNSFFPTFNPSGLLPANLNGKLGTPRQYVGAIVEEMKINGTFGSAQGEQWAVAFGPKTGYRWQTFNNAGAPNGGSLDIGVEVLFANRGVTLGNVFAAGGAPLTINSSANMNTMYSAFVKYNFGVGH